MNTRSLLEERREISKWVCDLCGRVIYGRRNTIHLDIISHINSEWNQGKREKPYDPYGRKLLPDSEQLARITSRR